MPIRLQKKATRVARAVVEEVNAARGVGSRTDKHGNVKTSLWDHGKVRARAWICGRWMGACAWMWGAGAITRGVRARGRRVTARVGWSTRADESIRARARFLEARFFWAR